MIDYMPSSNTQVFFKYVMERQYHNKKFGMKKIVEEFGNSEMKQIFSNSSHAAVTDAHMPCLISTNEKFCERFQAWILFEDFGDIEIHDRKPRSRSEASV